MDYVNAGYMAELNELHALCEGIEKWVEKSGGGINRPVLVVRDIRITNDRIRAALARMEAMGGMEEI